MSSIMEDIQKIREKYIVKGYRKDNGDPVYGFPIFGYSGMPCSILVTNPNARAGLEMIVEVDPFALCQFTGLYDKNGKKEMFYGDEVDYKGTKYYIWQEEGYTVGFVGFFELDAFTSMWPLDQIARDLELTGKNIHDD